MDTVQILQPSNHVDYDCLPECYDYAFKVNIIGDFGVGKSSLLMKFADDKFPTTPLATVGLDYKVVNLRLDGSIVKLCLWDTAGTEAFKNICAQYYGGSQGVIVVYDSTNMESFKNAKDFWIPQIDSTRAREDVNKLLIGNKCDLAEKAVHSCMGKELADQLGIPFMETSAKNSINVTNVFTKITTDILRRVGSQPGKPGNSRNIRIGSAPVYPTQQWYFGGNYGGSWCTLA